MLIDMLYREFSLDNPARWQAAQSFIAANLNANPPLRLIVTTAESKRNAEQNKLYWKAIIQPISDQVWLQGKQFDKDVWHEHYSRKFGYFDEITLPSGEKVLRRKSTSEFKVKEFSEYITKIEADASQEYGVRFPAKE